MIVGWRVSRSLRSDLLLDALEQALYARPNIKCLVRHSDRGEQYLSICYTERLSEADIAPSVGNVGDSYDNALADMPPIFRHTRLPACPSDLSAVAF